jgi:hypothetical protein
MGRLPLIALWAVLGGCTRFPAITDGVCGNAVLDPDEDCDTFAALGPKTSCAPASDPRGCHYLCEGTAECPSGWRCGVDAQCRHPSGGYSVEMSVPFAADRIEIGDADGDRIADLLGSGLNTLSILYGGPDGARDHLRIWKMPSPPEWKDIDGDGRVDAIVPTAPGTLVFLGTGERRLTPATFSGGGGAGSLVFGLSMEKDKEVLGDAVKLALFSKCFNVESGFGGSFCGGCTAGESCINGQCVPDSQTCAPGRDGLCDGARLCRNGGCVFVTGCATPLHVDYPQAPGSRRYTIDDLWTPLPIGDVFGTGNDAFAFAFRDARQLYVYQTLGSPRALTTTASIAQIVPLAPGYSIRARVFFADVDGDGRADLVIPATNGEARDTGLNVAFFDPSMGRFGPACPASLHFFEPNNIMRRAPPAFALRAAGDLTGDGVADYILEESALIVESVARPQVPCSDAAPVVIEALEQSGPEPEESWSEASTGTYSGSGFMDAVASSSSTLDFVLGSRAGLSTLRIEVPSTPRMLRSGDYDGDGVEDVAFAYTQPGNTMSCPERTILAVIFGPPDASSEPVVMGAFCETLRDFEPYDAPGSEPDDAAKDLIISTADQNRTKVMFGSTGRRMLCPAAFSSQAASQQSLIGHFCTRCTSTTCSSASDLVFAQHRFVNGDQTGVLALARSDGIEPGGLASTANFDYGPNMLPWTGRPASMAAIDLDEDGLDEVLGFDSNGLMMIAHRNQNPCTDGAPMADLPPPFDPRFSAGRFFGNAQIETADLDRDGHLDLLVLFGTSSVAVAWGTGIMDLKLTELAIPPATSIIQVTHADLGCDASPDLLLLAASTNKPDGSDAAIYRMGFDASARTFHGWELMARAPFGRSLAAGDVNGDGLIDIVWIDDSNGHMLFALPGVGPSCEISR